MAIEFKVPDMACGACAETITKAIKAIAPDAVVEADSKTKLVRVDTEVTETAIRSAITHAGYSVA